MTELTTPATQAAESVLSPSTPATIAAATRSGGGQADTTTPPMRDASGRFLTGNSGGGRPRGSKNRLTEAFMSAIADDFAEHGADAIAEVRATDPATYLRIIGALLPRELIMQREREPDIDWDHITIDEFLQLLDAAKHREFLRRTLFSVEPSVDLQAKPPR